MTANQPTPNRSIKVLRELLNNSHPTASDVAKTLGVSRRAVHYCIDKLKTQYGVGIEVRYQQPGNSQTAYYAVTGPGLIDTGHDYFKNSDKK